MYSAGIPAISADSEWPWPDIRWHVPQTVPGGTPPPLTMAGGEGCSSGNQSGVLAVLMASPAEYSLLLPGTWTVPVIGLVGGCTLSGMLKAQAGSPLGMAVGGGACAGAGKLASNTARDPKSRASGRIVRCLLEYLIRHLRLPELPRPAIRRRIHPD